MVAHQAPLSMGFSRHEYWSEFLYPSPGDLPNLGIKPMSLASPALAGSFFTPRATWETLYHAPAGKYFEYSTPPPPPSRPAEPHTWKHPEARV